jgi:hypothetical protein
MMNPSQRVGPGVKGKTGKRSPERDPAPRAMPLRTAQRPQKYDVCTPNRIDKATKQIGAISLTDWCGVLKNEARPLRGGILEWAVPQDLRGLYRVGA